MSKAKTPADVLNRFWEQPTDRIPARWQARPCLVLEDVIDLPALARRIRDASDAFSQLTQMTFSDETWRLLESAEDLDRPSESLQQALIRDLNHLVLGPCLYHEEAFAGKNLTRKTRKLLAKAPADHTESAAELNLLLLQAAYPEEVQYQPFVGPRPFEGRFELRFFGRDQEGLDIAMRVIARRATVLYAPSGAGKTSLVNARIIPRLLDEDCELLPIARVQGPLANGQEFMADDNPFTYHVLRCWAAEDNNSQERLDLGLADATLGGFLEQRLSTTVAIARPRPLVAIFDQFEELFTSYPEHWKKRWELMEQISDALKRHPQLRVLFALREDFIAELDPYVDLFPEQLRMRIRMERLRKDPAIEAIAGPLRRTVWSIEADVANHLVDALRTNKITKPNGETLEVEEEFVEPVQLQVVCQQFWDDVRKHVSPDQDVTTEHVDRFADVPGAIGAFYGDCIGEAVSTFGVKEGAVRNWFESRLLTQAGSRGFVFRGKKESGGLDNRIVELLESLYIIKADVLGRQRWYTLTHDRFIAPIREMNAHWFDETFRDERAAYKDLHARAKSFGEAKEKGESGEDLLLDGSELAIAERCLGVHESKGVSTDPKVRRFVNESAKMLKQKEVQYAQGLAELRKRRKRLWQILAFVLAVLVVGALAMNHRMNLLKKDSERQLASKFITDGYNSVIARDLASAAHWWSKARLTDPDSKSNDGVHSMRLRATAQQLPIVSDLKVHEVGQSELAVTDAQISRDGRWAIRAFQGWKGEADHESGEARLLDLERGNEHVFAKGSPVLLAAFNDDSNTLITVSQRGDQQNREPFVAKIWNLERLPPADCEAELQRKGQVKKVVLSPGGERAALVVSTKANGVRLERPIVWNWAKNNEPEDVKELGHVGTVTHLSFGPHGNRVLTAIRDKSADDNDRDHYLRFWDADTGQAAGQPGTGPAGLEHSNTVIYARFGPKGNCLFSAEEATDGTANAYVWYGLDDLISQRLVKEATTKPGFVDVPGHIDDVTAASFSEDGTKLLTASKDRHARIYGISGEGASMVVRKEKELLHTSFVWDAAFSRDNRWVVTASRDHHVRVWDATSGELVVPLMRHRGSVTRAAFDPSGRYVLTIAGFRGQPLPGPRAHAEHEAPNEIRLAEELRIWDLAVTNRALAPCVPLHQTMTFASFSPSGRYLLTQSSSGEVGLTKIPETSSEEDAITANLEEWPSGHRLRLAAFSKDLESGNETYLVTVSDRGETERSGDDETTQTKTIIWRVSDIGKTSRHSELSLPHAKDAIAQRVQAISFSGNGRRMVAVVRKNSKEAVPDEAFVWDLQKLKWVDMEPVKHGSRLRLAALDPQGAKLLTVAERNEDPEDASANAAKVWFLDRQNGALRSASLEHDDAVLFAAFDPSGNRVVTSSVDDTAKVWSLEGGPREIAQLPHSSDVLTAAFNFDGSRVATGTQNGFARIWDANSGASVTPLLENVGGVRGIAFCPDEDGRLVATSTEAEIVTVWDAETGDLVAPPWDFRKENRRVERMALVGQKDYALLIQTASQGYFDRSNVLTWQFSSGCAKQVAHEISALAPVEFDSDYSLIPLRSTKNLKEEWGNAEESVQKRTSQQSMQAWHQSQADTCRRSDPEAALWHLEQLGALCLTEEFRERVKLSIKSTAADLARKRAFRDLKTARDYSDRRAWDKAIDVLSSILEKHAGFLESDLEQEVWRGRANARVQRVLERPKKRDYEQDLTLALDDLRDVRDAVPDDLYLAHDVAVLELSTGDLAAYRSSCAAMLRWLRSKGFSARDANTVAWTCSLGPDAVNNDQWAEITSLSARAVEDAAPDLRKVYQNTHGAALYRAAEDGYQAAIDEFKSANQTQTDRFWDQVFLAMAYQRLGNHEDAQLALQDAEQLAEEFETGERFSWSARLEVRILLDEARRTVREPASGGGLAPEQDKNRSADVRYSPPSMTPVTGGARRSA